VMYLPFSEDAIIFRLRRDREYLAAPEAEELAALLRAYWEAGDEMPSRVNEAIWRMAFTPRLRNGQVVNGMLVGGLEVLLKVGTGPVTQQFKQRANAMASDLRHRRH
jgi:hypothetical protein